MRTLALMLMVASPAALAAEVSALTPGVSQESGTMTLSLKLGGYKPLIDSEAGLKGTPYADIFGSGAMLLGEIEAERYFWHGYGSAGASLSVGYAEKYASALAPPGANVDVKTALKVVPIRLAGTYRYDYLALHFGIPFVPYAKVGLVYTPWWSSKGAAAVDYADGVRAAGGKWGFELVGGLSLMLDVLEPRLAHDFASDLGVVHTYLFGEFTYADVNNFGQNGLDLSSRHWMFGLAFEY